MPHPLRSLLPLITVSATALWAVDAPQPVAPAPATAPAPASNWVFTGRVGAFFANVVTSNADESRDATIVSTKESTSWLLSYEGSANWKDGPNSVDNLLKARYGRIRTQGESWLENNDELRYDGVYRREVSKPHFAYLGWGAESVFTGVEPDESAFDPTLGKVSVGYGQRYEGFVPDKSTFEARVGARAQQKWGDSVSGEDDDVQTGLEAFARYEQQLKRGEGEYDIRFFAQYEAFSEFEDVEHITHLITAGLAMQVTKHLAVELGLRAFYETRPEGDDGTGIGYNDWSLRQDSLIGLTYLY